jgi:hypothetical protein
MGLGVAEAWATSCDVYFGVYCLLLAAGYVVASNVQLHRVPSPTVRKSYVRALDILGVCLVGLVAALLVRHGWEFAFLGRVVRVRTVYTPLLILVTLVGIRIGLHYRTSLSPDTRERTITLLRAAAVAGVVTCVLMGPLLLAMSEQFQSGSFVRPRIFWRTSPPGIDLIAWFVPNPNHPLAPASIRSWLSHLTRDGYLENVASIPFVALGVIAVAAFGRWRVPRAPLAIAVGFALLATGPFLRIAGVDTHLAGPWALLRYVPILELARSPSRFSIMVMLGVAALMASGLSALVGRRPAWRRPILALVTVLLLAELAPAVPLHSAAIPSIYQTIAKDPRPEAAVLELPFGVRDGTMSVGNFTARTQFFQTAHGKPILGGYLSRVTQRRVVETRRHPVLRSLLYLSEGQTLSPSAFPITRAKWDEFTAANGVGYVVLDYARATPELQSLITSKLHLTEIGQDGPFHLYRP